MLSISKDAPSHNDSSIPTVPELELFFDNSIDIMILVGFDNRIKLINPSFQRILGWTKEEVILRLFQDFLHPDDIKRSLGEAKAYESGRNAVRFENRYRCKDGSYRWISWNSHPLPEKQVVVGIGRDITENKKAEEALKESEAKFKTLAENAPDAIMRFDKNLRVSYLNPQDLAATGKTLEEFIGKTNEEMGMPSELCKLWNSMFEKAKTSGQVQHVDFDFGTSEEVKTYSLRIVPEFAKDGSLISYMGISRDITERKKAEEELRKSQEMEYSQRKELEALMETVPATIWISHDPDCLNMTGNQATYDLLRLPKSANVSETAPEEQRPASFLAYDTQGKPIPLPDLPMQVAARTGKPVFNSEFEFRFKDGRSVWVYGNVMPLRDVKGALHGAIGAYVDITQIKRLQIKLEEYGKNLEKLVEERTKQLEITSAYARNLLEASLDPLVTISKEGKITDVNRATEGVTGRSREEMIGSDFSNYFTEPEAAKAGYKKAFTEGLVKDYPLAIKHTCGKITQVSYNASVYTDNSGEIQGIFAAARDITELKKAEEEAQETAKKLKDSERLAAIGVTAGMVGHDIRNPLQAITGDLFLTKSELADLPDNEQKKNALESLDEIQSNIDYINKIVADLQDYARPLNPRAQATDITLVFNEMLKNGIPENVKVTVDVEDKARHVMADADFLKRIVGNLTLNAVQAMPDGGELTVRACLDRQTKATVITVKDTGVGIPEDVKPKLFTPMMTTKSKGQGFGLAVVKRMAEGLGGTVTFESEAGKGTTFTVRLPPPKS